MPFGARSWREPCGEVADWEDIEGAEEGGVEMEVAEKAVESTFVLLLEAVLVMEGWVDMELAREGVALVGECAESWDELRLRLRLLMLVVGEAWLPHCRVTVLIPLLVLVLAGMTRVTRPS